MSVESVREHLREAGLKIDIIEMDSSTATVDLAARALGVKTAQIAKTMALRLKERDILLVTNGDVRIDNRKFRDYFREKARFIAVDDLLDATGHPIGGVCPFGLSKPLDIYLDISLKELDYVYPAAGEANSCLKISIGDLEAISKGSWVDVCKN